MRRSAAGRCRAPMARGKGNRGRENGVGRRVRGGGKREMGYGLSSGGTPWRWLGGVKCQEEEKGSNRKRGREGGGRGWRAQRC